MVSSFVAELYREFEKQDLETLKFLHDDIALFVRIREQFPDNRGLQDWAEYFIRLAQVEIENTVKEIEYDRRQIQEFANI